MLQQLFKGNNKFFSASVILFILVLAIGFYEPVKIKELELNWRKSQIIRSEKIASEAAEEINKINSKFNESFKEIFKKIKLQITKGGNFRGFTNILPNNNYSLLIWRDSSLVFWKNEKSSDENFENRFLPGEIFFEKTKLTAELAVYDTFEVADVNYLVKFSKAVEKFYKFDNDYFDPVSLIKIISDKTKIDCKINFSAGAEISKDGRVISTPIYNNFNNKIGMLYFPKTQVSFEKRELKRKFSAFRNSLTILIFFLFSIGLFREIKNKRKKYLEFLTVLFLTVVLRYALYFLQIPKIFLSGKIIGPQYFSSSFGFGIASSPLELTVTLSFLFAFTFYLLILLKDCLIKNLESRRKTALIVFFALGVVSPLFFRGFAASVRSFIFESNLQYFNSSNLFPNALNSLMLVNLLILSVSFVNLFLLLFVFTFASVKRKLKNILFLGFCFLAEFSLFSLFSHPLLTLPFKLTTLIFLMYFSFVLWNSKSSRVWNYFFLVLFASVLALLVLSNFNDELRRESIKVAAREINRPKENLYDFWLTQFINDKRTASLLERVAAREENPSAAAFKLWSKSPFQKDDVPISFRIVNVSGEILGGFDYKFPEDFFLSFQPEVKENFQVRKINLSGSKTILSGVKKIGNGEFLAVIIPLNAGSDELLPVPKFVETKRFLNRIQIGGGDFFSFKLTTTGINYIYGKPNLSAKQIKTIRSAKFSELNEAWLESEIEGSAFQLYLLKGSRTSKNIRVIGLKKSSLAFTWFHFIKLFFFHSLLIFGIFLFGFVWQSIRKREFKLTFRLRLTAAFFVAAIIPLILLASYLRYTTKEKNAEAINYKLNERAKQIERYIKAQRKSRDFYSVLNSASKNLGINFSVFRDSLLVYSSYLQYYEAGLFPPLSDYSANLRLMRGGKYKTLLDEKIENYTYHSVFYKTGFSPDLIIEVNDAFNLIRLPMSQGEFDIFLFGIYALAFIFTLIISTLLANQISNPIHRLTRATASVGQGDLNIRISENYKGEIGELVRGFNFMVKELRKSQKELGELEREIAWKEMARQVAHEIKNPLTPMKLSVQHLLAAYRDKSPKFNEIIERVATTLIDQIEMLKNIASEFGNVAKMPKPKLEKINLLEIIKETENLFREESIGIEVESPKDKILILGDEDNLRRIFINLIRNSIQANASKINFKIQSAQGVIILRISDDGEGIPPEYQDKIFELNFTTKPEGMGLGLSIGKKFLESIGAEMTLEKSSPGGTSFLISFRQRGEE